MNKICLKELTLEITKGTTPTTIGDSFVEAGINFVKAECLNTGKIIDKKSLSYITSKTHDKLSRSHLQEKDLLFSIAGHLGKMAIVTSEDLPANTNQAVAIIRANEKKANVNFIYYFLASNTMQNYVNNQCAQSVQPNINLTQIGDLPIINLSLKDQQKIASILSSLDAKIELNNRINAELEAMAKTLYDYWFVQFDFPNENGKPYKSSGGAMEYNAELKREIPKGWEVKSLVDIADFYNGLAMQKHRPIDDNRLKVIKIKEMNEGFGKHTEYARADVDKEAIIQNGDILFSWSATLDVIIWSKGIGALNQHIFKVTSATYPKSFYFYELLNYLEHFKMMANLRKTTMGHITKEHLQQSRISIPPMELIQKLDQKISIFLNKKVILEQENQQLAELRDWLLPMLMNGQVRVA